MFLLLLHKRCDPLKADLVANKLAQCKHKSSMRGPLGRWKGRVNLLSTSLDDFDLILGNEFFVKATVMVLPHLNGLLFMDETQPCFVRGMSKVPKRGKSSREGKLSTMQMEKGLEVSQKTYATALMGSKSYCVPTIVTQEVSPTRGRRSGQQASTVQAQEFHEGTSRQMERLCLEWES